MVQNPPANARDMRELCSMGREDPLEKGRETDSRILAWRIPCTQAWAATVHGSQESEMTEFP